MESKDFLAVVVVFVVTIIIAGVFFSGSSTDIARAIDKKYILESTEGNIKTYKSTDAINNTVSGIVAMKQPYDQKIDTAGTSILLYNEAVVVINEQDGETKIELTKDHETAYRRHSNIMIMYWGGNLMRNGRIATPKSLRNGSIGSSPSRGGGFSFGK